MAEVVIDSYPPESNASVATAFQAGSDAKYGQTFTANGTAIGRLLVSMGKVGNPTGNMVAKIYAITGSFGSTAEPTGAVLAQSEPIDMFSLSTTGGQPIFLFRGANGINLANATNFAWVVDATAGSVDVSNYPTIGVDVTSSTHAGNSAFGFIGVWATTAADAVFYLYGTDTPSITASPATSVSSTKATLNGVIGGIGTSSIDGRGFVYGTSSQSNPGNTAPASTPYTGRITNTGSFSVGSFSNTATGLESSATYYVRAYSHNASGYAYSDEVTFDTKNLTRVSFSGIDPTDMVKGILDNTTSRGSVVDYDGSSTDDTGTTVSYTFNTATALEGVQVAHKLSPSDWYWYVDPGTSILHFKQTSATPVHRLTKGRHLEQLNLKLSTEEVKNIVYFTGGIPDSETENLFRIYTDQTSIDNYGQRLERITDNRITLQSTAEKYGGGTIATGKDEKHYTTVDVLDGTFDITLFKPGDTVGFNGFGNFIDLLILQIARIEYNRQKVRLSLGYLPYRLSADFEQFKRDLFMLQSVANPDSVS